MLAIGPHCGRTTAMTIIAIVGSDARRRSVFSVAQLICSSVTQKRNQPMTRSFLPTFRHLRVLLACIAALAVLGTANMQAAGQVFVPLIVSPVPSKGYYVDCTGGNDANSGTSESAAWKSLAKARAAALLPGD